MQSYSTKITSRKRGPCTPLIRVISISAVAEGPEINVVANPAVACQRPSPPAPSPPHPASPPRTDDSPAPASSPAVPARHRLQHNRPRLRNRQRRLRHHPIHRIQLRRRQPLIHHKLKPRRPSLATQPRRNHHPPHPALRQHLRRTCATSPRSTRTPAHHNPAACPPATPDHRSSLPPPPVRTYSRAIPSHSAATTSAEEAPPIAARIRPSTSSRADPSNSQSPFFTLALSHQSRNVSFGISCRSLTCVHPPSNPRQPLDPPILPCAPAATPPPAPSAAPPETAARSGRPSPSPSSQSPQH